MSVSSLNPGLIELIYDAASIRRWNDQVNPMDFTELDKQSHKMVIAYILARFEETREAGSIDWLRLIEGGMFEMLHRIVLTDIKPPVFHKMMANLGDKLNDWVCRNLEEKLSQVRGGFAERFHKYFMDPSYSVREKRVLKAAHFLATQWEFNILYKMCPFINGVEQIRKDIEDQIEDHYDLLGVQKISLKRKTADFVELCGQLRFQKRWSQSPRIPVTSVLGHMLVVAMLTYLALQDTDACDARKTNGFWAGLFHDLPEVLTRDITTPVKKSVEELDELIKDYEKEQMEEKLFPLLPADWHQDLKYYTEDEFSNRARSNGKIVSGLTFEELDKNYNLPEHEAIDGEIIRGCDHLAAFIEASLSIRHGVTSRHLQEGIDRLYPDYRVKWIGPVNFGQAFEAIVPDLDGAPKADTFVIRPDRWGRLMLPALYGMMEGPHGQRIRYESRDGILHVGNWYRAPDCVYWKFEAETAGTYELTIDHSVESGEGGSVLGVIVNGRKAQKMAPNGKPFASSGGTIVTEASIEFKSRSTNGKFQKRKLGMVQLDKGINEIRFQLGKVGKTKGIDLRGAMLRLQKA